MKAMDRVSWVLDFDEYNLKKITEIDKWAARDIVIITFSNAESWNKKCREVFLTNFEAFRNEVNNCLYCLLYLRNRNLNLMADKLKKYIQIETISFILTWWIDEFIKFCMSHSL